MISAEKASGILEKARSLRSKGKSPEEALAWLKKKLPDPGELPEASRAVFAEFLLAAGRDEEALEIGTAILQSSETGDMVVGVREWMSENLPAFRDQSTALDAVWIHHARSGDWDGGRKLVKLASREVPEAIADLRARAESREKDASTAPFAHAAFAHIALAEGRLPETVLRLRSCLYGPRTLIRHAAMALKMLKEKKPDNPEIRWALLETGHLTGEDWVEDAIAISAGNPERMTDYIREATEKSTATTREGLTRLAEAMTRRHPGLAAAWEVLGDLSEDDPRREVEVLSEVVKLVPGSEPARNAMRRIDEVAGETRHDLDIVFGRIRALIYLPDLDRAREAVESRVGVDPKRVLALISEARGAGVGLSDEFSLVEAASLHHLGRDPEAADRIRSASDVSAAQRADALIRMRADSPASPDLACALAEVYLLGDGYQQAETLLTGLLEQATAAAPAILQWLDTTAAEPLADHAGATALRARSELACGKERDALARIGELAAAGDRRSDILLSIASVQRIKGAPDVDLDLDVLKLLAETGQDAELALRFVRRLRGQGAGERVAGILDSRVPGDQSTEEEWLHTLGALYVDLDRPADAVTVARSGGSPALVLGALKRLTDLVPEKDRWRPLEAAAEVLHESNAGAAKELDLLAKILEEHPDRTDAVRDLLERTSDAGDSQARRLILLGRCEAALGHTGCALDFFLDGARAAPAGERAQILDRCAVELEGIVGADPANDAARVVQSQVGQLRGSAGKTLEPVLSAVDRTPALYARLDEIGEEFPEVHDALWTSVEWHRASGNHAEAVVRLGKLLLVAPGSRDRIRETAEVLFTESGSIDALRVVADVDRQGGDPERVAESCHRIFLADAGTGAEVAERLAVIRGLYPGSMPATVTGLEIALATDDLAGMVGIAQEALALNPGAEGAGECADAFAKGSRLPESSTSVDYWTVLADLRARSGDGPGAVDALRRWAGMEGADLPSVRQPLLAMRKEDALPVEGLDLLVDCSRRLRDPLPLAQAIRWRLDAGGVDGAGRRRLREAAGEVAEVAGDTTGLRSILEEFCIEARDGEGALGQVLSSAEGMGAGKLASRLEHLVEQFPDLAAVPLETALRVHAPAGRAGEAALAVERGYDLDQDLALARGLPLLEGLREEGKEDPELFRVAARLLIQAGEGEAALASLNRLVESGEEYRSVATGMFGELVGACPENLEARIRWAEVLAESAAGEEGDRNLWEVCVLRCREVLGKGPVRDDELRATKLLADALEGCGSFDEAAAVLRSGREKFPEEPELPVRLRRVHLAHMDSISTGAEPATIRAEALLLAGRARQALGILDGVDSEGEEGEPDLDVLAVRTRAHFSCGHFDRIVAEGAALAEDLPPTGSLDPRLRELLYYKGRAFLRLGEEARGIRLLERLARDHPCHRACRAFLEEHYRRADAREVESLTITAALEEVRHHGHA